MAIAEPARRDILPALLEAVMELSASDSLEDVLNSALERSVELLDAQRALIALFDDSGAVAKHSAFNMQDGDDAIGSVSQSLLHQVMETGQLVLVSDVDQDQQFQKRKSVKRNGIQFMVGVPIMPRHGPRGVLYVDSQAHALVLIPERVEVLELMGALIANAVQSAYLLDTVERQERQLTSTVHDMRLPLSTISLNAELLAESAVAPPDSQEIGYDIVAAGQRLSQMVAEILEQARMKTDPGHPEVVPVEKEIRTHIESLDPLLAAHSARVTVQAEPGLPHVHALRSRVAVVLDNLIFNAIRHGKSNSTITLRLSQRSTRGPSTAARPGLEKYRVLKRGLRLEPAPGCSFVEVGVHNGGDPIPPAKLPHVFSEFVGSEQRPGGQLSSGLGLSIAARCVDSWGGAIWVSSSRFEGTTFSFSIPTHVSLQGARA